MTQGGGGPKGSLPVIAHSEAQSFAIGNVQVSKVVVDVTATSTVSGAGGDAHVVAGQVTANSPPGAVNDQGGTIQDKQPIPRPAVPETPSPPSAPSPPPPPSTPPPGAATPG